MDALLHDLTRLGLEPAREGLSALIEEKMALVGRDFGNEKKFRTIVEALPDMFGEGIDITGRRVSVIPRDDHAPEEMDALLTGLRDLRPWRKGPYGLFGIDIDTEWDFELAEARLAVAGGVA